MTTQKEQVDLSEVGDWCEKWTSVVRVFAEKQPARRSLCEEEYRNLHTELLDACQAAISHPEVTHQQQATLHELQSLAQPWMSLESLQTASQKIAQDLLRQSEVCQEVFGKRKPARKYSMPFVFLLIFGVGFLVTMGFTVTGDSGLAAFFAEGVFGAMHWIAGGIGFLREQSLVWPMGTAIFGLLVGLAYIVFRAPRNY